MKYCLSCDIWWEDKDENCRACGNRLPRNDYSSEDADDATRAIDKPAKDSNGSK